MPVKGSRRTLSRTSTRATCWGFPMPASGRTVSLEARLLLCGRSRVHDQRQGRP
ncbi:MAG: hypothetical protein M0C28_06000 [Candidatus Moduliflexus flocculans]|nr:hypothetical protein [Candidatus Moduliflexus flocculans]